MEVGEILKFIRQKDYKFVRDIDGGGQGTTKLLLDETIGEHFVVKKYEPAVVEQKKELFDYFVREIKILHALYHRNVVRVFNHYLFPHQYTGFIIMEYIDGVSIDDYLKNKPEHINDIFTQTIDGFLHLEQAKIYHRDIRPQNIMVTHTGIVKIIDFGFGKQPNFEEEPNNSIQLNWPYSRPDELDNDIYDHRTEIYFVAKLFEWIISKNSIGGFAYHDLLKEMLNDYDSRISDFFEVSKSILEKPFAEIAFSHYDRAVYQSFVSSFVSSISKIHVDATYLTDQNQILGELSKLYSASLLEDYVQALGELVQIFIKGNFFYVKGYKFPVVTLHDFLKLFRKSSVSERQLILLHIAKRANNIVRYDPADELPF